MMLNIFSCVYCCAVLSRSVVSNSLWPHGLACQAPLFMGFSRQVYWSGLPCPPPGDLPNTGIEPRSLPHCRWILYRLSHQGSCIIFGEVSTLILFFFNIYLASQVFVVARRIFVAAHGLLSSCGTRTPECTDSVGVVLRLSYPETYGS